MIEFNYDEVLHTNGDYVVRICTVRDPVLESEIAAYGIYNTQTKVREAEARRLKNAISICDYIASPTPSIEELAGQYNLNLDPSLN